MNLNSKEAFEYLDCYKECHFNLDYAAAMVFDEMSSEKETSFFHRFAWRIVEEFFGFSK